MTSSQLTTEQARARSEAVGRGVVRAGVPKRYQDVPPMALDGERWAYVTGKVGSGKTYRSCSYLRGYVEGHMACTTDREMWFPPKCAFVTANDYLRAVRERYRDQDGWSRADIYLDTPFLVLDDLGMENPTRWTGSEILRLVDFRYSHGLQTVVTSLFAPGDLARRLADNGGDEQGLSVASRLFEACDLVDMGDHDRRLDGPMPPTVTVESPWDL